MTGHSSVALAGFTGQINVAGVERLPIGCADSGGTAFFFMKNADGDRFLRALRETLDTVVTPIVRDALIHDALILSGKLALPTERAAMIEFAKGALRTVTERALGVELADSVAEEIARMTEATRITSAPPPPHMRRPTPQPRTARAVPGHRRTPAPSAKRTDTMPGHRPPTVPPSQPEASDRHPTMTPVPRPLRRGQPAPSLSPWPSGMGSHIRRPVEPEASTPSSARDYAESTGISGSALVAPRAADVREPPCVFVATEDASLFTTLAQWFAGRAVIVQVHGVLDLVRHLDAAHERRAIVVLDGRSPSIRPQALAVLIEELSDVDVMMCRAAPATEEIVLAASQASARWLVYREPASLDHIAAECLRLVS
jgi:hypothetical protein